MHSKTTVDVDRGSRRKHNLTLSQIRIQSQEAKTSNSEHLSLTCLD